MFNFVKRIYLNTSYYNCFSPKASSGTVCFELEFLGNAVVKHIYVKYAYIRVMGKGSWVGLWVVSFRVATFGSF